jgi:hypothetical protein
MSQYELIPGLMVDDDKALKILESLEKNLMEGARKIQEVLRVTPDRAMQIARQALGKE